MATQSDKPIEQCPVVTPTLEKKKFTFNEQLNTEFLKSSYSDNLEFGEKMFGLFLTTVSEDVADLKTFVAEMNYESTRALAHKIKNNFTWVGLPMLSSIMYKIENSAADKNQDLTVLFSEMQIQFEKYLPTIKAEHKRLAEYLK